MKRLTHPVLKFLGLLVLLVPLPGCSDDPDRYSAEAIEGWVVDAETKQPLAGVIVTANWELEVGTVGGNVPVGQLQVMEAVTDKEGRFHFPAWGPKPIPPRPKPEKLSERIMVYLLSNRPHFTDRDPQLLFFKRGYAYRGLQNTLVSNKGPLRRSDWHGKTIEIKYFKGSLEAYAEHFEDLNNDLEHVVADYPENCDWKKIPRTIMTMKQQREYFESKGINPYTLSTIDERLFTNDDYYAKKGIPPCGSPKEFFEKYQP